MLVFFSFHISWENVSHHSFLPHQLKGMFDKMSTIAKSAMSKMNYLLSYKILLSILQPAVDFSMRIAALVWENCLRLLKLLKIKYPSWETSMWGMLNFSVLGHNFLRIYIYIYITICIRHTVYKMGKFCIN